MIDPQSLTKRYYKIGEVAKMFGVATSLIRYWEGEFSELKPQKNNKGVRRFLKEDVLVVNIIYDLVKVKGYKLEGAKLAMANKEYPTPAQITKPIKRDLNQLIILKEELKAIRTNLVKLRDQL